MPSLTIASDNEEGDNEAEEDCHDDDESEDEGIDDTAADVEEIAPAADISSVPRRQFIEDQFFMEDVARIVVGGQNRRTIRCRHCIDTVTFSDTRVRMMNHLARKHDSLWALIAPTPRPLTTPATAAPKAPFDVFAASLTAYASGPNNVEASLGYQITTCITIPDLILNEYTELMTWVIKQSTSKSFSTTALMGFMNKTVLNRRDLVDRQAGLPQRTVSAIVKNRWNLFRNGHFQRLHDDMAALDALTNSERCEFEERDAIAEALSPDDDHRSESKIAKRACYYVWKGNIF